MAALHQSYSFRDHRGYIARFNTYVPDLAAGLNLPAPTQALTNAQFCAANGPYTAKGAASLFGALATFPNVEDKAVIVLSDSGHNLHRFEIPAPIEAIFLADLEVLDVLNGLVITWANAMIGNARTPSDLAFTDLISGGRIRRRNRTDLPGVRNPSP